MQAHRYSKEPRPEAHLSDSEQKSSSVDTAKGIPGHPARQTTLGYVLGITNILHTLYFAVACLTLARAIIPAPCQRGTVQAGKCLKLCLS